MFVLNLKSAHWPPNTIYHHRERPCCFLVTILLAVLGFGCESRVKLIVQNCFHGVFQNILLVQNGALPFTFPQMLSMFSETYQGFKFMPLVTFSHVLFFLVIVLYGTDSEISMPMKITCFQILALVNKALWTLGCMYLFKLMVFFPGIYQEEDCCVIVLYFWFFENLPYCLHSGYINLLFHQQCLKFHFSPHPHQHLLFVFLMVAILMGLRW